MYLMFPNKYSYTLQFTQIHRLLGKKFAQKTIHDSGLPNNIDQTPVCLRRHLPDGIKPIRLVIIVIENGY